MFVDLDDEEEMRALRAEVELWKKHADEAIVVARGIWQRRRFDDDHTIVKELHKRLLTLEEKRPDFLKGLGLSGKLSAAERHRDEYQTALREIWTIVNGDIAETATTAVKRFKAQTQDSITSMAAVLSERDKRIEELTKQRDCWERMYHDGSKAHAADITKFEELLKAAKRWEDGFRAIASHFVLAPDQPFEIDDIVGKMAELRERLDKMLVRARFRLDDRISGTYAASIVKMLWRKP